MKKWIAASLVVLLVISLLAGCSSKNDEQADGKNSAGGKNLLDKPEKIFNGDNVFDLYLDVITETGTQMTTTVIGMQGLQSTEGVIYTATYSETAYSAVVVEVSATGTFAVYRRTSPADAFVLDTAATQADVDEIKTFVTSILDVVTGMDWESGDKKLQKISPDNADVYTYKILVDGESKGTINVNKENGMVMSVDTEETSLYVTDYDLTDARIPTYK